MIYLYCILGALAWLGSGFYGVWLAECDMRKEYGNHKSYFKVGESILLTSMGPIILIASLCICSDIFSRPMFKPKSKGKNE